MDSCTAYLINLLGREDIPENKYLVYSNTTQSKNTVIYQSDLQEEINVLYEENIKTLDPCSLSMTNAFKLAKVRI